MKQIHRDDKLFITEINANTKEGYLRRMKRCDAFPKEGRMLAIAFGHEGKLRICNAQGYMTSFLEVDSLEKLPAAAAGKYSLVAVYYVVENLDDAEPPTFFHHINELLLAGGSLLVVVSLQQGKSKLKTLKEVCRRQGFDEVYTELWKREPLNTWNHRGNSGRHLSSLMGRIPLLRYLFARTASVLFEKVETTNKTAIS